MTDNVRVALTETINVYPMPERLEGLAALAPHLDDLRQANVDHHIELLRAAKAQDVDLICFGELFPAPYFAITWSHIWQSLAEPRDGPTMTALSRAARELGIAIVAPIFELDGEDRFNTAVFLDKSGEEVGHYRKVHIPHGQNEEASFFERDYYGESRGMVNEHPANISSNEFFPVFDLDFAKVGCCICYDRHFEGIVTTLAREGAEIIFCPAVTFGEKSRRMWDMEFEVDAVRNNVFLGGSNRRGIEPPWNQEYFGASYFVGPNGRLRNISQHENLVVADVPMKQLREPDPSGWQLVAHRRDRSIYE
jgi:N-carbamoylputrescine amidase